MFAFTTSFERRMEVAWGIEEAFDLVADVPRSASHFPGLVQLDDLGDGVYRWNMESFRIKRFTYAISYAARYVSDRDAWTVVWTTVGNEGNTRADGVWTLTPGPGSGTTLVFENTIEASLPIPRLMGRVARGIVGELSQRQVDAYLKRIAKTMEGRVVG